MWRPWSCASRRVRSMPPTMRYQLPPRTGSLLILQLREPAGAGIGYRAEQCQVLASYYSLSAARVEGGKELG